MVLGPDARLFRKMRLKALGLLDVERLEVAEPGVGLEPVQRLRDAVQCRLAEPFASVRYVKYARLIRSF